jgi:zinc protease
MRASLILPVMLGGAAVAALGGLTPTPAFSFEIVSVKGSHGMEAWLVETPELPVIALHIAFRDAGSAADPHGRQGLAAFGARMLTEGAGEFDASAYQERLSELGAALTFTADRDAIVGRLEAVRDHRDQTFELLRLALTKPRFDADAVERVRKSRLAKLTRLETDPNYVARRTWWQGVFPNHPYGRDPGGTEADTAAITEEDLRSAFMSRIAKGNLIISAAGAISVAELAEALDRVFGDLPDREMSSAVPAAVFAPSEPLVVRMPFPQSSCWFGHGGVRPTSPDYFPAIVLNHIVGGGTLTSRLFVELREKRGLVYSVRTNLEPLSDETLIIGWFATENDKVSKAIELVRREWRRLTRGEISDADLDEEGVPQGGVATLARRHLDHGGAAARGPAPRPRDGSSDRMERQGRCGHCRNGPLPGGSPHEAGRPHIRDRGGPYWPVTAPWGCRTCWPTTSHRQQPRLQQMNACSRLVQRIIEAGEYEIGSGEPNGNQRGKKE